MSVDDWGNEEIGAVYIRENIDCSVVNMMDTGGVELVWRQKWRCETMKAMPCNYTSMMDIYGVMGKMLVEQMEIGCIWWGIRGDMGMEVLLE